jgi:hypothetical protein
VPSKPDLSSIVADAWEFFQARHADQIQAGG